MLQLVPFWRLEGHDIVLMYTRPCMDTLKGVHTIENKKAIRGGRQYEYLVFVLICRVHYSNLPSNFQHYTAFT